VRSKLLWTVAALLLLYTLGGFLLAPYVVQRYLPSLAEAHLGQRASVAEIRINPFTLTFEASGFRLEGAGDKPLLAFKRLFVDFELSSLFRRAWTFADIRVEGADLALVIDAQGRLNLLDIIERLRKPPRPDEGPPRLVIGHVALDGSRVGLVDHSGATPASAQVTPIDLELYELSTLADQEGRYTLDAKLPGGGTLAWKGTLSLQPIASAGELVLRGMKLETPWRFLRDELHLAPPQGELSIAGRYDFTFAQGKAALAASALQAELSGLSVASRDDKRPLLALRTVRVSDASFALEKREIVIPKVLLSDGALNASMSERGELDWQQLTPRAASEVAKADAQTRDAPGAHPWRIRMQSIGVEKVALHYDDRSRKPALAVRTAALNGSLGLEVTTGAGAAQMIADEISLALEGNAVTSPGSDAPLVTLQSFTLSGGRIDIGKRAAGAKTIAITGGDIKIARGRDGSMGALDALFAGKDIAPDRPAKKSPAANAWRYSVDTLALKHFAVAFADRTHTPALAYDLNVVSAGATHIDSGSKAPIAFTTQLKIGKRGTASGKGTLRQDFAGASAKVDLARIVLEPLQPLLAKHAALDLKSGNASASAQLTYRRGAQPSVSARGRFSVDDFLVNEAHSGERFAAWKTLAGDDVALSLAPNKLAIREVRLLEPGAKIVIAKDRTINLTDVFRKGPVSGGAPTKGPAQAAPAAAAATAEPAPFPYEIGRIRLEKGTLDFADLSLVLPFATRVQALGGSIVGISSAPQARAELKLAGQIDAYGEARAEGVLIPRSPTTFLDITARFDNVEMPPLSPYSATFAGRKVAAGKLSLVLEYKIVNSQLAGENRMVLRDFKLGERVKAPNALDLPLDLAIALLKDSEGKISLAVPVRGNVGSPEFDYGKVISAAIGNAIVRVVTAPFRLLAGLFGKSDAEAIRKVAFAPGSERIAPAQREQLDALAKALQARPQLKLVVRGPYDAGRDGEALRRASARLELARRMGSALKPGEDPGPIAYGTAETQRALEALLAQRGGPEAISELAAAYAKRTGTRPDRVNPVLGLFGRGSKDREFYEAVFARIVALEPLPDEAPRLLAARRAQAIVDALAKAGVSPGRLQSGGITQLKSGSGTAIETELALDVMPGAS
jgi:hypothetical protein